MPVGRKRKTKTPEEVPGAGGPERSRVLNILAQRRYRQRQREKIAALEARANCQRSPQPVSQNGGIPVHEVFPELASATSSEALPDGPIERIERSSDNFDLPEIDFRQDSLDMSLVDDLNVCYLPTINSLATCTQSSSFSASPPTFNFPLSRDVQLQLPILNAIRAFSSIATTLNIMKLVWDLNYLHVLPPMPAPNLPWNLQPTPAQQTIPHHPVLDVLPWPSVREKLICILALPSMFRPPIAQDNDPCGTGQANAIQRLMHDLDDVQEGPRVYGDGLGWDSCSELLEDAWEMGECFYRNWWFCIDPNAVVTTNRRRRERGVRPLRLTG